MNRALGFAAVVLALIAVALGGVALVRSGRKPPSPSVADVTALKSEKARVAKADSRIAALKTELTTIWNAERGQHVVIGRVTTCLPELWTYLNSATVQQDSNNYLFLNFGQQLASPCQKFLTGY